jgi:hypothetical protein
MLTIQIYRMPGEKMVINKNEFSIFHMINIKYFYYYIENYFSYYLYCYVIVNIVLISCHAI